MRRWIVTLALLSAFGIYDSAFAQSDTPLRILRVGLSLHPSKADLDAENVDALRAPGLDWFSHVLLSVSSWQEYPAATRHLLVTHALNICQTRGIPVIWGRNLWVGWETLSAAPPVLPDAHLYPAHYVAAIQRVQTEAREIGAVATFLDVEPYGYSAQMPIKKADLSEKDRLRVAAAIAAALRVVDPVDYVKPTASNRPGHYAWPMVDLGLLRCDTKTYKSAPPDWLVPKVRPPPGYQQRIDVWSAWVGRDALTVDQVKLWNLGLIRKRYPECRGLLVRMEMDEFAALARSW